MAADEELNELKRIVREAILNMKAEYKLPLMANTHNLTHLVATALHDLGAKPENLLRNQEKLRQICQFAFSLANDPSLTPSDIKPLTQQFIVALDDPKNKMNPKLMDAEELLDHTKSLFKALYRLEPTMFPGVKEEEAEEKLDKLASTASTLIKYGPQGLSDEDKAQIAMLGHLLRNNAFRQAVVDVSKTNDYGLTFMGIRDALKACFLELEDKEKAYGLPLELDPDAPLESTSSSMTPLSMKPIPPGGKH
jgi:hypothetical protein